MKRENFSLSITDGSEPRGFFFEATENVGRETSIRLGARLIIFRRCRCDLLLDVLRVDQLIELFDVLDESLDNLRIESSANHAAQQCQRLFAFHSLAVRAIATRGIVEIDY